MNPDIASALAEMDKINVSRLEHPGPLALEPASCRFLAAFIRATGARKVLEFGSGFSSLMIARELGEQEGSYLLSIDNSPQYSRLAKDSVESSESRAKTEFRVAPLRPKFYGMRLLLSYSLPKGLLEALGPFDLVLIDPPHHQYGRESVFYDAFPALAPGGYVILDDANREEAEKKYLSSWDAAYGDAINPVVLEGIGKGLAVIEKLEDVPRWPLPAGESVLATLETLRNAGRLLFGRKE
ncbi:MAG TPA: hypothetical protein DCZ92_01775 [Elusimicrobia bacterium]|nr:MAG: hypothetical protein A2016_07710 [Elusimicrobia bacterium GWF2_62_30]HBA59555.1 hypothetical protein [Elusimicrobiota bacterium]